MRASDYSFVEFRSLKRLVAIHGRYSYLRMRQLVLYSFYKNIAFILVIFWFGIYRSERTQQSCLDTAPAAARDGPLTRSVVPTFHGFRTDAGRPRSAWSGQSIYNDSILAMVNVIYLSLPPLVQGIFEKDVSEHVIYGEPKVLPPSGGGGPAGAAAGGGLTFPSTLRSRSVGAPVALPRGAAQHLLQHRGGHGVDGLWVLPMRRPVFPDRVGGQRRRHNDRL